MIVTGRHLDGLMCVARVEEGDRATVAAVFFDLLSGR